MRKLLYAQHHGKPSAPDDELLIPVGHFSQINDAANELLVQAVDSQAGQGEITDLYAGSGNFSLPLARRGCKVTAVELDPCLVKCGREQASAEDLQTLLSFEQSSCERFVRRNALAATVILDPPRAGVKEIIRAFSPQTTQKLIYVSCNLPNLCRDLQSLNTQGYALRQVSVLDMFPQSHHVETISLLQAN